MLESALKIGGHRVEMFADRDKIAGRGRSN